MTKIELTNIITPEFLNSQIVAVKYERLGEKITHCRIIVKSGFTFTGESACIDPANYDETIGKKIAYDNAFDKMWGAYGFWLSQKRYEIDPNFADSLDYTVAVPEYPSLDEEVYQMTGDEKFTLEMAVALAQSGEYVRNTETGVTLNPEDVSPVALWQLVPDDELLADTPKGDWLDRLCVETSDLSEKISKLQFTLESGKPEKVSSKQWELLNKQFNAMQQYKRLLCERLDEANGINDDVAG